MPQEEFWLQGKWHKFLLCNKDYILAYRQEGIWRKFHQDTDKGLEGEVSFPFHKRRDQQK